MKRMSEQSKISRKEERTMRNGRYVVAAVAAAIMIAAVIAGGIGVEMAGAQQQSASCKWGTEEYSHGAQICKSGQIWQCNNGQWDKVGGKGDKCP